MKTRPDLTGVGRIIFDELGGAAFAARCRDIEQEGAYTLRVLPLAGAGFRIAFRSLDDRYALFTDTADVTLLNAEELGAAVEVLMAPALPARKVRP